MTDSAATCDCLGAVGPKDKCALCNPRRLTPIYVVTVPHADGERAVYEGTSRRSARIFKSRDVMARSWRYFTTEREPFDV